MAKSKKDKREKTAKKLVRNYLSESENVEDMKEGKSSDNIISQTSKHQKELEHQNQMQRVYLKKDLSKTLFYVLFSLAVIIGIFFLTRR
ncbi:hypothetical protein KC660_00700 [Candidatus Dojkabacteria bacterium]|uniref:Uncharacterized protein n=1 Tax=Candidatus Dojkabacteria bacterium TaxID=2099670 RepID=A0A955L2V8_9BACT|nr:hypothetical protein [Candidatus Dojkabacteria bacterium]